MTHATVRRTLSRARWLLLALVSVLLLPWAGLALSAALQPLPAALATPVRSNVLVVDRDGQLLHEVTLAGTSAVANPVSLAELSPWVVPALVAAEDARFFEHPGVDPLAVTRAFGQLVWQRQVVSGGSTLTQQLARTLVPRRRSLLGKLNEMALALRIEASFSKQRILEEYLSRVEFGPNLRGIDAASRHYFAKSAAQLDLAEAAALVSLPRGPALYDPRRRPQLLERRRLRVLGRMAALGLAPPGALARAELTPIRIAQLPKAWGAEHLSFELAERLATTDAPKTRLLRTTLSAELQRSAERIADAALPSLAEHGGSAIALLVVDNESADVLAYVGSADYFDVRKHGANDGVSARRQPGSALKPFVYAAAMQELGYGAATLLPDVPRDFLVPGGRFAPRDYDQRFRGPVLLRQALGSSLNMPALEVAARVGPPRVLEMLHRFGFASLDRSAEHYGVGLALGDGEVTLLELVTAYAALARGGELLPSRLVLAEQAAASPEPARRVLRPEIAALLSDVLADDGARAAGFGRDSVLNLPFPVAAKTGTSKGYRDNWAVGYTREVTVGVWVGNFDGTPLRDASGITAAGPAFHDLMLAAMRGREPKPLFDASLLSVLEVCTLSGKRPGAACEHVRRERFVRGSEPAEACDMHALAQVDAQGREVAARCGVGTRILERYPDTLRTWAEAAGRPLAGRAVSATCPPERDRSAPRVTFPRDGQVFVLDPDGPERQEIALGASSSAAQLRFIVDGRPGPQRPAPFQQTLRLTPGSHSVVVEAEGRLSPPLRFEVSAAVPGP
ncbi:MAG TPA: penicillin-binding protein 1C [Polyangiaceae bacterium]|nr:penicillin-binding protein 1C [Polyangiaceae bacterium]